MFFFYSTGPLAGEVYKLKCLSVCLSVWLFLCLFVPHNSAIYLILSISNLKNTFKKSIKLVLLYGLLSIWLNMYIYFQRISPCDVRPSIHILSPAHEIFFGRLSLALRSHDQIPASHWSPPFNYYYLKKKINYPTSPKLY